MAEIASKLYPTQSAAMTNGKLPSDASLDYRRWTNRIFDLAIAVRALKPLALELGLPSPSQEAWDGSLFQKLLPQVEQPPFLIVAVTGGTNTGKSVVFNHLAGGSVSRSHPNATQTKHPVCIVPRDFAVKDSLGEVFPDFQLRPWRSDDDPLLECDEQLLLVRDDPTGQQPARLLLLDTPDIDGTLKANWRRADLIRHAADVRVCVLTQQKYNDAAIREFFRAAAEAEKTVLVAFNMVHWPRQRDLCYGWLDQFCRATGIEPAAAYAVPWDSDAADENRLPFHPLTEGATDLREDLAELRFDAIKIRSLTGSLRQVIDPNDGLPRFLSSIDRRANEYAGARDLLDHDIRKQDVELPDLPRRLVWQEIWNWLDSRRTKFDRWIHGAYRSLGQVVARLWQRDPQDALHAFRIADFDQLQLALAVKLDQLDRLRRGGNEILSRELDGVLGGLERDRLFAELRRRHAEAPLVTDGYRQFIREQLDAFERQNPALVKGVSWAMIATAVVRPAISVGLAIVGAHGVEMAAGHWALSWAGDVAMGTASVAAGEAVAIPTGQLALKTLLSGLFARFYFERVKLLTKTMDDVVLGPLVDRLNRLAEARHDPARMRADHLLLELRRSLRETVAEGHHGFDS
ncbi:MAG: 50S ribosome-binding GTPase [Pirellulales bacterium]|nr:50S ribosome-binding GTPase [Pirellulales bacterium]